MTPGARRPHLILVGLPGAGKSTVGPLAAARLGRPFVDFDAELERRAGRTVAEQFARDGESAFRAAEAALSVELAAAEPAVLAPGGGWMANPAAREALAAAGRTVYLRVPPAVAAARLAGDRHLRPLLAGAADPLAAVGGGRGPRAGGGRGGGPRGGRGAGLARRGPLYEAADAVVDAAEAPDQVAERVAAAARAWAGGDAGPAEPAGG